MSGMRWRSVVTALAALAGWAGPAAAAVYAVHELPTVLPRPDNDWWATARDIDQDGHVLATVEVVKNNQVFSAGELCSLDDCRHLSKHTHSTDWRAMNPQGDTAGTVWSDGVAYASRRIAGQGVALLQRGNAYDINASGVIVGATLKVRPFVYDTALRYLPTPGGTQGRAYGINDQGMVVGQLYVAATGDSHAFIYRDGVTTDLAANAPEFRNSMALGVNNAGIVVGCANTRAGEPTVAAVWREGRVAYLGALVAGTRGGACATAINESGQHVVGVSDVDPLDATRRHGFVHDRSAMRDLNDLLRPEDAGRYEIREPGAINDRGQIAATAVRLADHQYVAVRLDPVE
ncbi:hypothetical protein [Ideonella sp.]|uniref:hypothetical protein n=1 Tax=Ideonella sp. TaxID=1929293 RepID=UPI0035AD7D88